ncbi:ATP-binding protein [Streptomyces erythrochromogenes]|uniref:ATP-binding protein n=1 Tax=Streptomyces erythrochromogenes TaxID=285574 RepID=UPI0033F10730
MGRGDGGGRLGAGAAHLRAEWGRWWRAEDWSDTHVAHYVLNDQYRTWMRFQQRHKAEVQQNIGLLKEQQKHQRQAQMMQMNLQRQRQRQGRYGYGGYGGAGGASPAISYKMMQWASLQMRIGQQEFRHQEITPSMLHIGRGQVRARRHWAAAGWLLALATGWVGLWWASVTAGLAVTLLAAAVFAVAAWSAGGSLKPRRPPVPKLLFIPPTAPAHTELAAEADQEPQPFPIRDAGRDPRQAREAVRLALAKEKVEFAEILVPEETTYGWKVPVVLKSGTAEHLISVLKFVATTLRVGRSQLMARAADPNDASQVALTILTRDPFAHSPSYPVRPPNSCSITDPFSIGVSIEGEHTPIVLAGQGVLIVARTGGGKSSMVRALAEYTTACHDAVAVDIDPMRRGLGPLSSCAVRSALTPEDAEKELEYLKALAEARIAALGPAEDNMPVSARNPAVIAFIDEFPELTSRGKELAVRLMRLGRKSRVTLVVCTTDATTDTMGDAIGDALGIRILMSCRKADVPLAVGQDDAVSQGWLPHLLVPSPGEWEIADAGRYYCVTPRHKEPVLRYVSHLDAGTALLRAQERTQAGLPALSWPSTGSTAPAAANTPPAIVALLLAAFATHSDPEMLTISQLGDYLVTVDPGTWAKWEGKKNRPLMIGRTIQAHLKAAGLTVKSVRVTTLPNQPTGYRLADIQGALS